MAVRHWFLRKYCLKNLTLYLNKKKKIILTFSIYCSSLQEKPSSNQLQSSGESQSFINEPVTLKAITTQHNTATAEAEKLTSHTSPEGSPQRKSLYDLSKLGDNELIVREEKRVSISWSRDNSPAPTPLTSSTLKTQNEEQQEDETLLSTAKEISQGARKKTLPSPLISSQDSSTKATEKPDDSPQKPAPSKALLQKIAMKETEPRKKYFYYYYFLILFTTIKCSFSFF